MRAAFDRKLRSARRRWSTDILLEQVGLALLGGGVVAGAALLIDRALAERLIQGWHLVALVGLLPVLGAALWIPKRPGRLRAAIRLDECLRTQERFSTALMLTGRKDAFCRAACAEARAAAEGVDLQGHFPVRPSRRWAWAVAAWVALGAAFWFMPDLDLLGRAARRRQQQQQARRLAEARTEVRRTLAVVESTVKQLGDRQLAEDLARLGDLRGPARPVEIQRAAVRKLGDMADRVKQMRKDQRAQAVRQVQSMLKRLRGSPGALDNKLNQALAKGDFSEAAKLLKELQKKLAADELSPAERKALADNLKDLGRQLERLAASGKALEDALAQAGADKKLASLDEQQLRQALKDAGLTDEQIEELIRQAGACRQACEGCRRLGRSLVSCGSGLAAGKPMLGELGECGEQLDELEAMAQRLALVEASLEDIEDAMAMLGRRGCQGTGAGLRLPGKVGSPGGGGQVYGLRKTGPETPTGLKKTGVKNTPQGGRVIASWYFKGPQVKGRSSREFAEVMRAAGDRAAEAISENRIPREHQPVVKRYFGDMEKPDR